VDQLVEYQLRVLPALVVAALFLVALPRKLVEFRIVAWILIFVLFRDAMTPVGLWQLGVPGFIRLPASVGLLMALGVSSVAIVLLMQAVEPELRSLVVWVRGDPFAGVGAGVATALLIAAPVYGLEMSKPESDHGAVAGFDLAPALLLMALMGNLYEEVLFRGYVQGYLERHVSPVRAAFLSGASFAFFHIFLATTVTNTGMPVLGFTLYEGLLCAFVRLRWGVAASTVAHGGAIFLIASGIA